MKSVIKGLSYMAVTVLFIECNFGKDSKTDESDSMELSASKTAPTLSSLDTKLTTLTTNTTKQLLNLNDSVKKINAAKILQDKDILTAKNSAKSAQDSATAINKKYLSLVRILDKAIFDTTQTGVLTIPAIYTLQQQVKALQNK